jgi:hypothetical protein
MSDGLEGMVVPAPGLQKLLNLRYLEVSPVHLMAIPRLLYDQIHYPTGSTMPGLDQYTEAFCPPGLLLPPTLEVLKVAPFCTGYYWDALQVMLKKQIESGFVTNLKKIILSSHFRDQEISEIIADHLWRDEPRDLRGDQPSWWTFLTDDCDEPRGCPLLEPTCIQSRVKLVIKHEDSFLWRIYGSPPPFWEIPEERAFEVKTEIQSRALRHQRFG